MQCALFCLLSSLLLSMLSFAHFAILCSLCFTLCWTQASSCGVLLAGNMMLDRPLAVSGDDPQRGTQALSSVHG